MAGYGLSNEHHLSTVLQESLKLKGHNIEVINGFKINYIYNNKKKRYIVDYYLPKLKILVEIKQ